MTVTGTPSNPNPNPHPNPDRDRDRDRNPNPSANPNPRRLSLTLCAPRTGTLRLPRLQPPCLLGCLHHACYQHASYTVAATCWIGGMVQLDRRAEGGGMVAPGMVATKTMQLP